MENIKKWGKKALIAAAQILGGLAYLTLLFLPVAFTEDSILWVLWIGLMLLATMYGAILYAITKEQDKTLSFFDRVKAAIPTTNKKFFLGVAIITIIFIVGAWLQEDEQETITNTQTNTYVAPATYTSPVSQPTFRQTVPVHYDSSYKYNYRTGYSGDYGYSYDVEGYSESGDYFYGNVDTEGKYGEGYIYDDYGNEVYVETEWIDYGVMEATDEYGNTYEFEVE